MNGHSDLCATCTALRGAYHPARNMPLKAQSNGQMCVRTYRDAINRSGF